MAILQDKSTPITPRMESLSCASPIEQDYDRNILKAIRAKVTKRVIPVVAIMYFLCFLDRINIGNVRLAGFERDLKLVGNDYNKLITCFFVPYIVADIPNTLLCKKIGPHRYLPFATVLFGLFTILQSVPSKFAQAAILRALLGVCEAGMLPGIAYYLSHWYRQAELAFFLSLYIVTAPLAGAFAGLLTSVLLTLPKVGIIETWRWVFLVQGLLTMVVGGLTFLLTSPIPTESRRPRWLTAEEAVALRSALATDRDDIAESIGYPDWKTLFNIVFSLPTFPTSMIFLFNSATVQGFGVFAPTIIRSIYPGKTVIKQQLLTVPPYMVAVVVLLGSTAISWKIKQRCTIMMASAVFVILGFSLLLSELSQIVKYIAMCFAAGAFGFGALCNAHVSANTRTDVARNVAIGFVTTMGNIGGLISSWIYLPGDAPRYSKGHGFNLGGNIFLLVTVLTMWYLMKRMNARRDQREQHHLDSSGHLSSHISNIESNRLDRKKDAAFPWKL
ncbi:MFS-type transporter-like protein 75 [Elsinoe fawcettii]|nr:MFS-type transporter-like protein 75 [Elsinoe fawcettii]